MNINFAHPFPPLPPPTENRPDRNKLDLSFHTFPFYSPRFSPLPSLSFPGIVEFAQAIARTTISAIYIRVKREDARSRNGRMENYDKKGWFSKHDFTGKGGGGEEREKLEKQKFLSSVIRCLNRSVTLSNQRTIHPRIHRGNGGDMVTDAYT